MMLRKLAGILAVWVLSLTLAAAQAPAPDQPAPAPDQPAVAQPDQPDQPGARGDRGGRMRGQRGDRMRGGFGQMENEQLKTDLKVTEDEWKALEPLIRNVRTAQRDAIPGMGRRFGMMGRGNRGPDGGGAQAGAPEGAPRMQQPAQMPEREALQTAINAEKPDPADIKAKLKAYKEAVAKKQEALKEARAKLREVCDARKEAVLVLAGVLD